MTLVRNDQRAAREFFLLETDILIRRLWLYNILLCALNVQQFIIKELNLFCHY